MRFNSRNMFLAMALGAFTMTATSGFASMMPATQAQTTPGAQHSQSYAQQSKKSQTRSISGTIEKSGSGYVLRASNGQEYQLSGATNAKKYAGKSVTVTGKVNASSHSISVQSIQPQ